MAGSSPGAVSFLDGARRRLLRLDLAARLAALPKAVGQAARAHPELIEAAIMAAILFTLGSGPYSRFI